MHPHSTASIRDAMFMKIAKLTVSRDTEVSCNLLNAIPGPDDAVDLGTTAITYHYYHSPVTRLYLALLPSITYHYYTMVFIIVVVRTTVFGSVMSSVENS